jgi:large subunit ribosomal protein L29
MGNVVKAKDLKAQTEEELETFVRERRDEVFKLRFQHYTGQLENVARMKLAKRELARALTVLNQKKRSAQA